MTKKRKLPSPRVLRRLLDYDPETGELRWKERPVWIFKNPQDHKTRKWNADKWNTRWAGRSALQATHSEGYRSGAIFYKKYFAHRVIWAIVYGEWPEHDIDHLNGDRSDNRLENLRAVTRSENLRNQKMNTRNTSGATGVYWFGERNKWIAQIKIDGKMKHLGTFDDFDSAVMARKSANPEHGYSSRHGRAKE